MKSIMYVQSGEYGELSYLTLLNKNHKKVNKKCIEPISTIIVEDDYNSHPLQKGVRELKTRHLHTS